MNFLTADVRRLYRKFLTASLGSALMISIYSIVDMIAIGQSEGPLGAAAMAVILVPFGLCTVLALLCGIGGAVFMSSARGQGDKEKGDEYYTCSWILMLVIMGVFWALLLAYRTPIFRAFGARDEATLQKALEYANWMIGFFPAFVLPTFVAAFVRNDGAPNRVLLAVIIGGAVNMWGDWFFVFPLGLGMTGAAMATTIGTALQLGIICTHFFNRKCQLKLVRPKHFVRYSGRILTAGLGAAILDLGNVVIVVFMNHQIQNYGTVTELAVYGVISSVGALFQAMYSGVGQAVQPLVSANFGAGLHDRMRRFFRLGFFTTILFGIGFTLLCELFPAQIVRVFVDATPELLKAAPEILRIYFVSLIPLGLNVLAAYYLQSELRDRQAMIVAVLRSIVLAGAALFALPAFLGLPGVWWALPVSETLTAVLAMTFVGKSLRDGARLPAA